MFIYQRVTPMAIVFVGKISFISIVKGVYKLTTSLGGTTLHSTWKDMELFLKWWYP
jgi:hypothetical protein